MHVGTTAPCAEAGRSAWEAVPSEPVTWPDLRGGVSGIDHERPLVTEDNGPLMARRIAVRPTPLTAPSSSPSSSIAAILGPRPPCQGSRSDRVRLGLDSAGSAETIERRGGCHYHLGSLQRLRRRCRSAVDGRPLVIWHSPIHRPTGTRLACRPICLRLIVCHADYYLSVWVYISYAEMDDALSSVNPKVSSVTSMRL